MKWIAINYPCPQTWLFKKDMPDHLRHEAKRVDFGVYGLAYCAFDHTGAILMKDGQRMPTYDFYLRTPGHVVGPRDLQAACTKPWAMEWQSACADRMMERLNLASELRTG